MAKAGAKTSKDPDRGGDVLLKKTATRSTHFYSHQRFFNHQRMSDRDCTKSKPPLYTKERVLKAKRKSGR